MRRSHTWEMREIIQARYGLFPLGEMAPGSCGISIQEADCIWMCTATRKYRSWVMGITVASIGHLLQCRTILRVRAQCEYYLVTAEAQAE